MSRNGHSILRGEDTGYDPLDDDDIEDPAFVSSRQWLAPINSNQDEEDTEDYDGNNNSSSKLYKLLPDLEAFRPKHKNSQNGNNSASLSFGNGGGHSPFMNRLSLLKSQPTSRRSSVGSFSQLNRFTKKYIIPAAKWAYSPLVSKRQSTVCGHSYKIEYPVFKPLANPLTITCEEDYIEKLVSLLETKEIDNLSTLQEILFPQLINAVKSVIAQIPPVRISQGSSGSYFIYGTNQILGIFKPKDEEPYGPLSPKWAKWLHRTFFPCFFGRSCLIPNLGYISEAAASVLDQQLLSYIVPHTEVISLTSSSFYYSYWQKQFDHELPLKIGSFQLFLNGYVDAQTWFKLHPIPLSRILPDTNEVTIHVDDDNTTNLDLKFRWSLATIQQFREELEKLVILDYIMRNTDRGFDNWMIKIIWREVSRSNNGYKSMTPILKIGAIDSGLAFPWKHPDEWRSFPYGWLFLPMSIIGQPFSMKTRRHYLPLLTSTWWWEDTVTKLKAVFQKDVDFKERMWLKQLAVIKGQAFNVVEVLKFNHLGPLELTRREQVFIRDEVVKVPETLANADLFYDENTQMYASTNSKSSPKIVPENKKKGHDTNGINEEDGIDVDDRTPLLLNQAEEESIPSSQLISGFDYNINYNNRETRKSIGGGIQEDEVEEISTTIMKEVIIERLEISHSKLPLLTWC